MKVIYLSGGIQDFSKAEIHNWRDKATKLLDHGTLDPTRFPYVDDKNLVEIEKADIDKSTHVLVYYIRPSVGTAMEVLYAWENKKIVYIVNEFGLELSPWMNYHSAKSFKTLDEAIEQINRDE